MRVAIGEVQRKFVHYSSSMIPLGYWLLGREWAVIILSAITVLMFAAEAARLRTEWGRKWYNKYFGTMTRTNEEFRLTGATFVVVGALLAAYLYEREVAVLAMLFLSFGDPSAGFIGLRFGRIKIGRKTVEGSLACLAVCLVLSPVTGLPLAIGIAGAVTATLAEAIPWRVINDNIAIPLFSGGVMTYLLANTV